MKKFLILLLTLTLILGVLVSCDKSLEKDSSDTTSTESTENSVVMRAKIIELDSQTALVEPLEDDPARKSSDRIWVSIEKFDDIEAKVGSIVDIVYEGYIMETYPAQIKASGWCKVSDPAK